MSDLLDRPKDESPPETYSCDAPNCPGKHPNKSNFCCSRCAAGLH